MICLQRWHMAKHAKVSVWYQSDHFINMTVVLLKQFKQGIFYENT